ncbi:MULTISPECIES: beta-ketoacyl-ACP synthase III [Psychrilyobacter]|uniref:Beta-ketoacyl-[acyl-carrier-protein] synthase III n=1 Tax=Psychrilyobacter piezotolerans TaxID=2293438 RepID=A0ABX9KL04_9FUSO|nr:MULTISPECIES: beta-ketoacyl-ACP synthase III [Psychrilyobacter]MCS5421784.1 ketoacyl-ACP synthase III [Psychrilyobacter sp. S5]NDI76465.1 ketoacyl-ACP synthase III [Psychrilyobacter piezotolerans]RDE66059.1 ketoacyl-ACP synthase III [Psychrilyobacter sp. S5]REI43237.1 beta-ketoacyl-ACP synthase III [Psychrilyobacter piezotolerans]
MKTLKNFGILGIGTYVPEKIMTNSDLEKIVDTSDAWIQKMTGIKERRIAAENEATSDLAYNAAVKALESSNTKAEEIDLIVVATLTPDYFTPSVSAMLQKRLGAHHAAAFDLGAACSGFVYGLEAGGNFIATGMYKKVLVIGAEVFSRILDWEDRNTCVLFGDGAAAAVLGEVEEGYGLIGSHLGADGDLDDVLIIPAGGSRTPATHETIDNRSHYLKMKGQEVFKFAVKAMPGAVEKVLENTGIGIDELELIVPHQANMRIISSAAKKLGFPAEKFVLNLDRYGNTSAASVGLALGEALEKGMIKKGDNIALVGFGAGLTYASCVMKWAY